MRSSGLPAVTATQGLLQIVAVGLFAAGLFTGIETLQFSSFIVFALLAVVGTWVGVLTPAGAMVSLAILGAGALLLDPWWKGYAWYAFVFGVIGLPKSLRQVLAPRSMIQQARGTIDRDGM